MKRTLLAATIVAIISAACGGGNDNPAIDTEGSAATTAMTMEESTGTTSATTTGTRTVEIKMVDIAYQPNTLTVKRGERIEFVFQNEGKIAHDAFIGDTAAQAEHEREMRQGDQTSTSAAHGMGGGDEKALTLDPAKTGRLFYTFDKTGTIEIGCHQPGHYAAGMKVAVTVA